MPDNGLKSREKIVLVDTNTTAITPSNPLVISFSPPAKPLDTRSAVGVVLADGEFLDIDLNNGLVVLAV